MSDGSGDSNTLHGVRREYTARQLELVRRIMGFNINYYEMLNVSRDASASEIKRSYKKLALKVHPDKNRAPGATDAFKLLGQAVEVLTDERKRTIYNDSIDGSSHFSIHTDSSNGRRRQQNQQNHRSGQRHSRRYSCRRRNRYHHNNNFDPFEEYFTDGFSRGDDYSGDDPSPDESTSSETENNTRNLLIGVILVVITLLMGIYIWSPDPLYSLEPKGTYSFRRYTNRLSLPYYVSASFSNEYDGLIKVIEKDVEDEFISLHRKRCNNERFIFQTKFMSSKRKLSEAEISNTPSCAILKGIGISRFNIFR